MNTINFIPTIIQKFNNNNNNATITITGVTTTTTSTHTEYITYNFHKGFHHSTSSTRQRPLNTAFELQRLVIHIQQTLL